MELVYSPIFLRERNSNEFPWLLTRDCSRTGFTVKLFPSRQLLSERCFSGWKRKWESSENSCCVKGQEEQTSAVSLVLPDSRLVENNKIHYLAQRNSLIWCVFKFQNSLLDNTVYLTGRQPWVEGSWWILVAKSIQLLSVVVVWMQRGSLLEQQFTEGVLFCKILRRICYWWQFNQK